MAVTTFIGLIVRYSVQEFDPSVSTITVTTSRVNNRDIASLSVSKHFLERILEFVEESIAIVATVIPLGFPLCTLVNNHFAKLRAGMDKIEISDDRVLMMIPKYVVIGDAQAVQLPNSNLLRPLVRDTIYQLIKTRLKPKLIVEDSYEEARKLAIRIGLIKRDHHKLAVIKSVDLLKNITDSRGDIKQGKVRYLLSRMKIMSQSTPADKSLLVYLIKHCESQPNENLAYLGYSFTDPEAMLAPDCAITFEDCDDEDVKKSAQVLLKSESMSFTSLYLFLVVCLLASNITQSYALYQISASVSCCVYRFLSITVFQEQLISHSQFTLLMIIQQVFAIMALMTKWLASLPESNARSAPAELAHAAREDSLDTRSRSVWSNAGKQHRSMASISAINGYETTSASSNQHREVHNLPSASSVKIHATADDTLGSSSSLDSSVSVNQEQLVEQFAAEEAAEHSAPDSQVVVKRPKYRGHHKRDSEQHIQLSGVDLNKAIIDSGLVSSYKQTFHNSPLIDDITYRLAKLHVFYQILVLIIIMLFGEFYFSLKSDPTN